MTTSKKDKSKVSGPTLQQLRRISFGYHNVTHYDVQQWLREHHKLNMIPKFYESGKYGFDVYKFNNDATGWTKVSGFLNKTAYTIEDAFENGFLWIVKYLLPNKEDENDDTSSVTKNDPKFFKMDLGSNEFKIV